MSINIDSVNKFYGNNHILKDISLDIKAGEMIAILGPSGSGKTTLIRALAGLETFDSGNFFVNGKNIAALPIHKRNFGFLFQNYALFRHLSVAKNIAYGIQNYHHKITKDELVHEVETAMTLCNIPLRFKESYPDHLSGGQKQRVALARAIAFHPELLLLDEPFSALDALVRKETRDNVYQLHKKIHLTTIIITHDQEEAFGLADRIAVIYQGEIVQFSTAKDLIQKPEHPFVEEFIQARLYNENQFELVSG